MYLLESLTNEASDANLQGVLASDQFLEYFERYQAFKEDVRRGDLGKTDQFWIQYIDILQQILMLIKATKENDLESHIGLLHDLCPLFFAFDHVNYARYTSVYLMTLENLENTHPGATELLKRNGFSVARSAVPKCRNPVDITIEQTINKQAKCQGVIVGFSRNYAAYYRWCTTRHYRAKYAAAIFDLADLTSDENAFHKETSQSHMQKNETDVKRTEEAISSFTNPFGTEQNCNELYCLSSGVPVKEEVANDLLNVMKKGKLCFDEFVEDRLVDRTVSFHSPIKRNKLKTFAASEVKKTIKSSQNKMTQIRAERNIFAQLVLLAVQNDIDLEMTLSYPLGPVPWSLATADGMPVKTDKSKLLHFLESHIEPTVTSSKEGMVHVFDGNALLYSLVAIPDTFEQVAEMIFNILPQDR